MSILLALATSTTLPVNAVPLPTTNPGTASSLLLWIVSTWAVIGVFTAFKLDAFRSHLILGPERLADNESSFDLLALLCASFGAQILGTMPVIRFVHLDTAFLSIVADLSGKVAGILAIVAGLGLLSVFGFRQIGLERRRLSLGVIGGAATLFILYPLIQLSAILIEYLVRLFGWRQAEPHQVLQILGRAPNRWLAVTCIVLAVIVAPVLEELFFRGLLQTSLARLFDWGIALFQQMLRGRGLTDDLDGLAISSRARILARWGAIIVTAALFAAVHFEPTFLAPLFVLAVGLGYAYERTGNLWVTITAHALFNTAQIVIYLAAQ